MIDIDQYLNSIQISWLERLTTSTHMISSWKIIKDEVLLTLSCPIFTSSQKSAHRKFKNLEAQKKSISMKNSQFFDYLLYAKS